MIIQAETLALPGVRHAFFTRRGGVSAGVYASLNGGIGSRDSANLVADNRTRMAAALGVGPDRLLTAYQIHSPHVVTIEAPWTSETRPRADAIVTRTRALAVGVTTADCGPILFADPQAGVVGAAHAGWRGALAGIVEATVDAMERLGAQRRQIRAVLGPMIRQDNYEVGPDLMARFRAEDSTQRSVLSARSAQGSCPVRPRRLYRGAAPPRRYPPGGGSRAVHLRRSGPLFQLPALDPPRRAGLRPPRERDCAGLSARMDE